MLTPLDPADPSEVGQYRLHGRLGTGGMGVVYQGFSPEGRAVAIKLPHDQIAADPEFRSRFEQEVTAARRVRGGFVAEVLDADVHAPRPWMATEYVDGVSLADAVRRRGPLDGVALIGLAAGLADALVAIHAAGVVHRDLKPSNVIMAWDGPKVIDFGIARTVDASNQTATGVLVGTVAWMAPEQLSGERAGPATDVFAWAACVAFAATGRHPFAAESQAATVGRILGGEPDLAGMPQSLEYLLRRALSKAPAARPTPTELVAVIAGRTVADVRDAEDAATRLVRGTPAGTPASPTRVEPTPEAAGWTSTGQPVPPPPGYWPSQPQTGGDPAPGRAWAGWQTPPAPGAVSDPRGTNPWQTPPPGWQPSPSQPSPSQSPSSQPPSSQGPANHAAAGQRAVDQAASSAAAAIWYPRSAPVPLPLRLVLAVAAVLAAVPVVIRTPEYVPGVDVWGVYQEFGLAILAFPLATAALVAANRYVPLREGAGGVVLGLSVLVVAEAATARQAAIGRDGVGAGWWLLVVAALTSFVSVVVWRGLTARWSPGRWSLAGCALLTFGVLLFAPEDPLWAQTLFSAEFAANPRGSSGDAIAIVAAATVIAIFAVVTFVATAGGANFFMALVAAGICVGEVAPPPDQSQSRVFAAGSAAVLLALLLFGLVLDRAGDRLLLFTARVAVAVTYLRVEIWPTVPLRPETDAAYAVATGLVVLLAVLSARSRRRPPVAGWPPGYSGYYHDRPYASQQRPGQQRPGPGGYYGGPPYYR